MRKQGWGWGCCGLCWLMRLGCGGCAVLSGGLWLWMVGDGGAWVV